MFVGEVNYLLELSAYCLMPFVSCKIVYIVVYFIGYRGISLSIVHIVLYSVASNLRQKARPCDWVVLMNYNRLVSRDSAILAS